MPGSSGFDIQEPRSANWTKRKLGPSSTASGDASGVASCAARTLVASPNVVRAAVLATSVSRRVSRLLKLLASRSNRVESILVCSVCLIRLKRHQMQRYDEEICSLDRSGIYAESNGFSSCFHSARRIVPIAIRFTTLLVLSDNARSASSRYSVLSDFPK